MARPKVQAHHIIMDSTNKRLFASYPRGTALVDLELIAANFAAQTGLRARALLARQDNQAHETPVIVVRVATTGDVEPALKTFKEMTDPTLPVAIWSLVIDVLLCQCNAVSTRAKDMRFVPGFRPEDEEAFGLRYYAAMQQVPVGQILSQDPHPPYRQLKNAIEDALESIGAYATAQVIVPGPDYRRCTHVK